jgi:RNA polymerase sigma-70 factor (ECF subfamily)
MSEPWTGSELRSLYEAYAPIIHRRASGLLRDETEAWDVVHEVFQKLLESESAFRREARPMTYVYRVTTNLCLNRLRAQRVRVHAPADPEPEAAHLGSSDARDLLRALLDQLDERALQIATLHFFDGLTQEEIGDVVGLSRKTVGKELEAVRQLASQLASLKKEVSRG